MTQTDTQNHRIKDMASYRLKQPRGRLSKNWFTIESLLKTNSAMKFFHSVTADAAWPNQKKAVVILVLEEKKLSETSQSIINPTLLLETYKSLALLKRGRSNSRFEVSINEGFSSFGMYSVLRF